MKTIHYVKVEKGEIENFSIRFPMNDFHFKVSAKVDEKFYPFSGNEKVESKSVKEYLTGFHIGVVMGMISQYQGTGFDKINTTLEIEIQELKDEKVHSNSLF